MMHAEPCLVCGAPIRHGGGHDSGCAIAHDACGYATAAHAEPCLLHRPGSTEPSVRPCMLTLDGYRRCPTESEARALYGDA